MRIGIKTIENGIMKKSLFFAAALLAMAACTRELDVNTPVGDMTITARTETSADTRTVVEGQTHVYWEPGDEISVFTTGKSGKFTTDIAESASTAEFKGSLNVTEGADLWAVYPYSEDAVYSGETITTVLPSEQVARAGSFGKDMNLAIAHSTTSDLQFYNVGGGVRFSVKEEGIKEVLFEGLGGEIISGKVKIGLDENGEPVVQEVTEGSRVITLFPPKGQDAFFSNTWYYFVVVPGTLEYGYKLTFYRENDYTRRASGKAVEIKRSIYGIIDEADAGCVYVPIPTTAIPVPDPVDLGLTVKWASFNVGAASPEGYGNYYAWGETQTKSEYTGANYKWEKLDTSTEIYKLTKYCTQASFGYDGYTDGKTILDSEDDAAFVNLGGQWRMPLTGEIVELLDKCTWEWTLLNGVNGYKVTGPNGGSLFLPAAGRKENASTFNAGLHGYYWFSSLSPFEPVYSGELGFDSNEIEFYWLVRWIGCPVRAVYGESHLIPIESITLDKSELELSVGEEFTLTATVHPQNATNKIVLWGSEDESIATVSSSGEVKGIAVGTTTIFAGNREWFFATCKVTVTEGTSFAPLPDAVDMGLPSGLK